MHALGEWCRRLRYLLNRRRLDADLQREMAIHRSMMGEPQRFGNTLRLREEARDAHSCSGHCRTLSRTVSSCSRRQTATAW